MNAGNIRPFISSFPEEQPHLQDNGTENSDNTHSISNDAPSFHKLELKGFKMAHFNITSLITKYINQLRLCLTQLPFDVLSINESRLDETISDHEINIDRYKVFRRDRNREDGEVAIYVKSSLNTCSGSSLIPSELEAVCVKIILLNASLFS